MIQIVLGRTADLWAHCALKLKDAYRAGGNVVLLVPEQYTLQAERDAMAALGVKGFFRLQVLSPSRLAKVVFERAGQDARVMIDERGQNMTLSRALWSLKDELSYYGGARNKPGFTQKLGEAISEFKSAGLSPDELEACLGAKEGGNPKLSDLALIYRAYEAAMAGQLADREDRERELLSRLEASSLFAGYEVLIHGFDLLTPPLIRLFTLLAGRAANLSLTLVADAGGAEDAGAFEPILSSLRQWTRALDAQGLRWQETGLPEPAAQGREALAHLQRQLLKLRQAPYAQAPEGLKLYAGKTPHEEIRRVAQLIHGQLQAGADPRGIAVFLAEEAYAALLPDVFTAYGIPHFVSVKEPITAQPLVRCLRDALRCVQAAAWRPQDVFSYLKNLYSPLNAQEAWALENYARAYGIRGKKWTQPFQKGGEEALAAIEPLRQKAIEPVMRLRDSLAKARDAAASIGVAAGFLSDIGAEDRAARVEEDFLARGMPEEAQRASQVLEQLTGLFEQMNQLLGSQRVPLGRFAEWLEAGLSMTSLAALPPMQRCVQAGLLGQLMTRGPHSVYILGLNSGTLNVSGEALVDDRERAAISGTTSKQLNLPLSARESIRQLDFWKAAAAAREQLHLSYALSDDQGKPLAPLMELGRIKKMFPKLLEEGGAVGSLREPRPFTPMIALDELALLLARGEMDEPWWSAWAWLNSSPEWRRYAEGIQSALLGDPPDKRLSQGTAARLYPEGVLSVSRLETYAGCPFRHFVDYGLRPLERREWGLKASDLGSFCHAAVDGFTRAALAEPGWPDVDKARSEALMDRVLEGLTEGWEEAPWADTERARKNARRTLDICRKMAWSLTEAQQHSDFRTGATELSFGIGTGQPPISICMEDGSVLLLRGTIDRLDTVVLDSGLRFVRIIDYKSGKTTLAGGEIELGLQLQLLLYLKAALLLLEEAQPAGAFYQPMRDPLVNARDAEEAKKLARRELRLRGLVLADSRVIGAMDRGEPPLTLARFVNKDGSLGKNRNLVDRVEIEALVALAEQRTRELARDLFAGLIARAPAVRANGTAECAWCEYQGICRTEKISREPLKRRARKIGLKELARETLQWPEGTAE